MPTVLPILQTDVRVSPRTNVDFDEKLATHGVELRAAAVDIWQVNVGKLCNQACKHCHVDASPKRTEIMTRETAEAVIDAVRRFRIPKLDITGGAPELKPSFLYFVTAAPALGSHVILRHNPTLMFHQRQNDLPEFLSSHPATLVFPFPSFLYQH